MDIQRRDPLDSRLHCLHQLLTLQVVLADITLGGNKEHGLGGVEHDALDSTLGLLEGLLSLVLSQLVNKDGRVVSVGGNSGEVVSLAMPCHLLHGLLKMNPDANALLKLGRRWLLPLCLGVGLACSDVGESSLQVLLRMQGQLRREELLRQNKSNLVAAMKRHRS